jgi:hypothetical protein
LIQRLVRLVAVCPRSAVSFPDQTCATIVANHGGAPVVEVSPPGCRLEQKSTFVLDLNTGVFTQTLRQM